MRPRATLVLASLLTGLVAVVGSLLGNAVDPRALFLGAVLGGAAGVVASVSLAVRLGWLASAERRGAVLGGWVGFAIAAPIAVLNLHGPFAPIASCALVGAGVLFGAGLTRRP